MGRGIFCGLWAKRKRIWIVSLCLVIFGLMFNVMAGPVVASTYSTSVGMYGKNVFGDTMVGLYNTFSYAISNGQITNMYQPGGQPSTGAGWWVTYNSGIILNQGGIYEYIFGHTVKYESIFSQNVKFQYTVYLYADTSNNVASYSMYNSWGNNVNVYFVPVPVDAIESA